jgi:hypothetical protein
MLGVDRLDMIKGIPQKLLAFEKFLYEHPEWRDKVLLVQVRGSHAGGREVPARAADCGRDQGLALPVASGAALHCRQPTGGAACVGGQPQARLRPALCRGSRVNSHYCPLSHAPGAPPSKIAVPSRTDVPEYQRLRSIVHEIVGRINGAFGTLTYVPIHHLDRQLSFHELCALYAVTGAARPPRRARRPPRA